MRLKFPGCLFLVLLSDESGSVDSEHSPACEVDSLKPSECSRNLSTYRCTQRLQANLKRLSLSCPLHAGLCFCPGDLPSHSTISSSALVVHQAPFTSGKWLLVDGRCKSTVLANRAADGNALRGGA